MLTLAQEDPSIFDFPGMMERKYGMVSNGKPNEEPRVFFRGRDSAQDILKQAQTEIFEPYRDAAYHKFDPDLDVGAGCGESCEVGGDD